VFARTNRRDHSGHDVNDVGETKRELDLVSATGALYGEVQTARLEASLARDRPFIVKRQYDATPQCVEFGRLAAEIVTI
jgi:hypothetical protein